MNQLIWKSWRPIMRLFIAGIAAIVLMGGQAFAQADWTQRLPAHVPLKRMYPAMAQFGSCSSFSSCGPSVVMFGGLNLGPTGVFDQFNVLADTWVWNGTDWAQVVTSGTPPARYGATMAYDPATGNAVLFGGRNANFQFLNDTWLFNSHLTCFLNAGCIKLFSWTEVTFPAGAATPTGRSEASMTYDRDLRLLVLTGGVTNLGLNLGFLNETWRFNPATNTWTRESPPSPFVIGSMEGVLRPGRSDAASATCDEDGEPFAGSFLFGGFNGSVNLPLGDTWLHAFRMTSDAWFQALPSAAPSARFGHGMAAYPVSNRAVLYGGQTNSQLTGTGVTPTDTWNGHCIGSTGEPTISNPFPSWSEVTPAHNPGPRMFHGMTTGPNGFTVLLFGGNDLPSPRSPNSSFPNGRDHDETWTWGRRVACLPRSGTQLLVGSEITCEFDPGQGIQFGGWRAIGFAPPFRDGLTTTFHTEAPGRASITAQWTDTQGTHIETFDYTIARRNQ